jgi:D-lyxose ketol-isomerase
MAECATIVIPREEGHSVKRSKINALIRDSIKFFESMNFRLPPWAYWKPEDWRDKSDTVSEIVDTMLGWDLTDFGRGEFENTGLILFTIRNGNFRNPHNRKTYAEKIMVVREEQETPYHFHWQKMEDIINRGGGNLVIDLYGSDKSEEPSNDPLVVSVDGLKRTIEAGGTVVLTPGESICLKPYMYHRFYGERGRGKVLVGEVSAVNDDTADNRFLETAGRFPEIEEDEKPLHLLVNDYKNWL